MARGDDEQVGLDARGILFLLLEHRGKVIGSLFGFIVGLVVIFFGWLKAISFVLCVAVGYFLGTRFDSGKGVLEFLQKVLPPPNR